LKLYSKESLFEFNEPEEMDTGTLDFVDPTTLVVKHSILVEKISPTIINQE